MDANRLILPLVINCNKIIFRSKNNLLSRKIIIPFSVLAALLSACVNPDIEILPARNTMEGTVKTLVAQIKPANAFGCDYSTVNVEYREQGSPTWINLGAPTPFIGNPGYHSYQIDIPGSNSFRYNQIFEQRWTAHVPAGTGWISSQFCKSPFDIVRTSSFIVSRAFDISFSPSPIVIPAGLSRNLNINVQRYGSFSDAVTVSAAVSEKSSLKVHPETIVISGSQGTVDVAAKLDLPPSDLTLQFNATSPTATGGSYFERIKIVSPFSFSTSPDPLEVVRGGSSPLIVQVERLSGFSGPVTLSFAGLPFGVTTSPNSPILVSGNSVQINIAASMNADIGRFNLVINGTAASAIQASDTVVVNVGRPRITSITPASQEKGMAITISGEGFNPNCYMNTVMIGTTGVVPTSCTATSINVTVPEGVQFGSTMLNVISNGLSSNNLPFRVRRKSGNFINVSSDIVSNRSNNRVCPSGLVKLEINGSENRYTATYRSVSTNNFLGSFGFAIDSAPYKVPGTDMDYTITAGNIGGAGFASCTSGVVFDAAPKNQSPGRVCIRLLDLTRGVFFRADPYYFNLYTGIEESYGTLYYSSEVLPRIYHSPDGSIIALVVASPNGFFSRISFIDQAFGGFVFREFDLGDVGGVQIILNTNNQIICSQGGNNYAPINLD